MLESPQILEVAAQGAAVIRLAVPRAEMKNVVGPALGELHAAIKVQGLAPRGPWFIRHFKMVPDAFDFEIGIPVASPIAPSGRVVAGQLPCSKVARAVYRGGYEGLGAAWAEFDKWITAQGQTTGEGLWERYLAGPESGPDASAWRTELNRPLL
jgi:effector-binding domain-containing protein